MLWGLLSAVLNSLFDVFNKKSINIIGKQISSFFAEFFGHLSSVILSLFFVILGYIHIGVTSLSLFLFAFLIKVLLGLINIPLQQQLFRENKISILLPYQRLNIIFVILCSFFLFKDISLISLCISLFTVFLIIGFSFNFKLRQLPKNIFVLLITQCIVMLISFFTAYLLSKVSVITYFSINAWLWGIAYLIIVTYLNDWKSMKVISFDFYFNKILSSVFRIGSGLITFFLIKHLGLAISVLLGSLGMGITLIFSYFILKDKPAIKDVILSIIVAILVGLATYLK